jgi:hypothetical protein
MPVPKVISLPTPVQIVAPVERWGLLNLTVNPFTRTASATLIATDANGERIPGGATLPLQVTNAQYDAAVAALIDPVLTAILTLAQANGVVDGAATIVDVSN